MVTQTHTEPRSPARSVAVALAGTLLIASTYGMARFGVGLFAPRLVGRAPGAGAGRRLGGRGPVRVVLAGRDSRGPGLGPPAPRRRAGRRGPPPHWAASGSRRPRPRAGSSSSSSWAARAPVSRRPPWCASSTPSPRPTRPQPPSPWSTPGRRSASSWPAPSPSRSRPPPAPGGPWRRSTPSPPAGCSCSSGAAAGSANPAASGSGTTYDWRRLATPAAAAAVVGAGSALLWSYGPLIATGRGRSTTAASGSCGSRSGWADSWAR